MGQRGCIHEKEGDMAKRGQELLEHGLGDMYDAEHRFADALETMIEQVTDESLVDGFTRHLRVTKGQIRRLETCFDELGKTPRREDCPGSKGLIAEYQKFVKEEKPDAATLNAFAAEAGQKVEHYEIVSYRSLVNLAQFLGFETCARLFKQNLAEEEEAAAELRSAGEILAAELTGAPTPGVVRRAAGTVFDQMREGAVVTVGTAKTVGGIATRRTGKAIERAERRGRRAVRSAQKRGQAAKRKTTRTAKTAARKTTARKATRPRTTAASRSRSTARKTTARASSRPKTGTRRPTRKTAGRSSARTRSRSRS
jgi:ferritin-like metal-binding protein YciE